MLQAQEYFVRQIDPKQFERVAVETGKSAQDGSDQTARPGNLPNEVKQAPKRKPHPRSFENAERWDGMS